jgi:hypothetical protein
MKKTVQIVTIPLNKEGWNEGDITLCVDAVMSGTNSIGTITIATYSYGIDNPYWKSQQLLVLSDDEIQGGDYFLEKDIVEQGFENALIQKCDGFIPRCWIKKIIASYPQLEGTLPISKETVQAWIDAGTPGEGNVEMIQKKPVGCSILNCEGMRTGSCDCFDEKWKIPKHDLQGNLLLEFSEKDEDYYDEDIYDAVIDFRKKHPEKVSVVKPSIPTDEEIEEKAKTFAQDSPLWGEGDSLSCLIDGYENGYKQALKDLGHE